MPLTVWFLAIYLISQAKTGLSALALKRQLGVSYPTAWLLHHKINRAMAQDVAAEHQPRFDFGVFGCQLAGVVRGIRCQLRLQGVALGAQGGQFGGKML